MARDLRRRKPVLVLLALWLSQPALGQAGSDAMNANAVLPADFFPLLPWGRSPSADQADDPVRGLPSMAECGFNLAGFVAPELLPRCEQHGLKAIVYPGALGVPKNQWATLTPEAIDAPENDGRRLYGYAAYEAWIEALEQDREDTSKHGNAFSYSQLLTSRQAAADYLTDISGELPDTAAGHLREAAEHYAAIAQRLADGQSCVMWPWDKTWTPANRAKEAGILRECLDDERAAVASIAAALVAIDQQ